MRKKEEIMHMAFIGTGNMGLPMLANLLKKGFSATAWPHRKTKHRFRGST